MKVYAGMDKSDFLGVPLMEALSRPAVTPASVTNLSWTGVYLSSPCHGNGDWMPAQTQLRVLGWGTAPLYVGRQDPSHCVNHAQTPAQGDADGQNAVAQANAAGCPPHSVVYLDWEVGSLTDAQLQYCRHWCAALAAGGYRPGFYAPPAALPLMNRAWPNLFIWIAEATKSIADIAAVDPLAMPPVVFQPFSPTQSSFPDAILWQCVETQLAPSGLATPWPPGFVFPGLGAQFPGFFNANGAPGFDIDWNSSSVADPSFPEARMDPTQIRKGRITAVRRSDDTASIVAIRRGALRAHVWNGVNGSTSAENTVGLPIALHPFAPLSSFVDPASGLLERLFVIARPDAGADDAWGVLQFFNVPGGGWQVDLVPVAQGTRFVDPLAGISACSRDLNTIELLAVDRSTGYLLSAQGTVFPPQWTPFKLIEFHPNRPSGIVVHSRTAGTTDLFAVSQQQRLVTAASAFPGLWGAPFAISHADLQLHPLANFAVVSRMPDEIVAVFVARSAVDPVWRLYETRWWQAGNWTGLFGGQGGPIGGVQIRPQPVSRLGAVSRRPEFIDLFVIGADDGFLYKTVYVQGGVWTPFVRIGGIPPIPLANVELALSRNPDAVDVFCSGTDGNLYVTTWRAGLPDFTGLTRVPAFDVQ